MQVSFVAEEWVDHAFSKSPEVESKLAHSNKDLAEAKKKYKDSLFHLEIGRASCRERVLVAV